MKSSKSERKLQSEVYKTQHEKREILQIKMKQNLCRILGYVMNFCVEILNYNYGAVTDFH